MAIVFVAFVGVGLVAHLSHTYYISDKHQKESFVFRSTAQSEQVKNADCKQLTVIYLNNDGQYPDHIEKMAKKHFEVKCLWSHLLELN